MPYPTAPNPRLRGTMVRGCYSLDLATINVGDVVCIMTERGRWYLTRVAGSNVHSDTISGVMVTTNSARKFPQIGADPSSFIVDRMVNRWQDFQVGHCSTGSVNSVSVNGEQRVG